jgi:lipopolysaccharide biosynthesis regulator YciM
VPIDREKVLQAAQKFVEKKRFDRAISEYQKIVQEDPNDARTLLKIGDLQARMQTFEAAIASMFRSWPSSMDTSSRSWPSSTKTWG